MTAAPPHWTTIDWSAHTHSAVVSGRTVSYVDYGAGDTVVLVHGLGGSWQSWLENIPALGARYRVIALDLAGFGLSDPLPHESDMTAHVETVTGLLDSLALDDAMVVGHSLGGLVTLCVAMWRPDRVRAVALVSGGGIPLSAARLALILQGFRLFSLLIHLPGVASRVARHAVLRRVLLGPALGDWRSMSPELARIAIPLMAAPGFVSTARIGAAALAAVDPRLVRAQTLMIWGENDRILPVHSARAMVRQMPDAQLVELPGIGHCAMFEVPDEVNRLLLEFLDQHAHESVDERHRDERTG
ncbi:hypothetical protein ASD11_00660 [Aeromicrobium sp. Root495]|uniref:alpha/beta fold hydrolase n=1 Tax=Aeromicrobium sp. Root495 TaxID=1736550 RepID=UPI0006FEA2A2|nr:alpha/beta hydrolase [Aeromicrobium sp. Root495]KQY58216.1 hypothetical protein ASD11_00660 [Aeromicrobium sp. Root495]